ncbi:Uncharacterised protein [Flavonifractor plautii]|uniref:Uncharacterized protein n=1 Tax=Flavonifractor plautii TaxID=292800 RepID=A0A174UGW3_FLAPL|nr:Uncharacterised protein [Flavonifractor plautii]
MANQEPDFCTRSSLAPRSRISPILEIPSPYMISNSASLKGGETLFLTTLARVRLPMISEPLFSDSMRRTSMRTEA